MKTKINNLDTKFTICTHSMFTGDNFIECEVGDSNFIVDHKEVVKDLAQKSIEVILSELDKCENCKGIVKDISLISSQSPAYYNYTTDSYVMEVDYDSKKVSKFIKDNNLSNEVNELNDKDKNRAELIIFLQYHVDIERYKSKMWDMEYEIYSQNTEIIEI